MLHDLEIGGEKDIEVALVDLLRISYHFQECFLRRKRKGRRQKPWAGKTYQRCRNRYSPPLIPRLHDRRINPLNRIRQTMEITRHQPMLREILSQDVKKLHQPRRNILRVRQVRHKRHPLPQPPQELARWQRMWIPSARGCVTHAQEARSDRVNGGDIELVEVAGAVDEHGALQRVLGHRIVANGVVGEIVEDLHGDEVAGGRDGLGPFEDGLVDDLDLGVVAARVGGLEKLLRLQRREVRRDLNDLVFCAVIDVRLGRPDVVEDVEHEGAVAGAHLVDD